MLAEKLDFTVATPAVSPSLQLVEKGAAPDLQIIPDTVAKPRTETPRERAQKILDLAWRHAIKQDRKNVFVALALLDKIQNDFLKTAFAWKLLMAERGEYHQTALKVLGTITNPQAKIAFAWKKIITKQQSNLIGAFTLLAALSDAELQSAARKKPELMKVISLCKRSSNKVLQQYAVELSKKFGPVDYAARVAQSLEGATGQDVIRGLYMLKILTPDALRQITSNDRSILMQIDTLRGDTEYRLPLIQKLAQEIWLKLDGEVVVLADAASVPAAVTKPSSKAAPTANNSGAFVCDNTPRVSGSKSRSKSNDVKNNWMKAAFVTFVRKPLQLAARIFADAPTTSPQNAREALTAEIKAPLANDYSDMALHTLS